MAIAIACSLENVSKLLTQELVQKVHAVTVFSCKPDKASTSKTFELAAATGSTNAPHFFN
ncbi:hypothetical protein BDD43_0503 [Mucilaginibacter gracilis]|uniref:Uncharacterized protein n=1 Tax=Mucilaginibacter gracilis TaxID=423350 RepID=A0A495IWK6_9SPHI|nr:hypothetical protein [Mucilaginibacter gracilis]RKR80398.1 hypothetical protein BDD43_0503 [Mucilaginibacter gracilis]